MSSLSQICQMTFLTSTTPFNGLGWIIPMSYRRWKNERTHRRTNGRIGGGQTGWWTDRRTRLMDGWIDEQTKQTAWAGCWAAFHATKRVMVFEGFYEDWRVRLNLIITDIFPLKRNETHYDDKRVMQLYFLLIPGSIGDHLDRRASIHP